MGAVAPYVQLARRRWSSILQNFEVLYEETEIRQIKAHMREDVHTESIETVQYDGRLGIHRLKTQAL